LPAGGFVMDQAVPDMPSATADIAAQAASLRQDAAAKLRAGASEDAARDCERAAALFESIGEPAEHSDTLNDLTLIYVILGLHDEALETITKSLTIARAAGDNRLMYWAYNRTGVVRSSMGDPVQADDFMRTALGLAETLGDQEKYCILNNLADNAHYLYHLYRDRGDAAAAAASVARGIDYARRALAIAADGRHPYQEALILGNYGYLLALNGEDEAGMAALARAASLAGSQGFANLALGAEHFVARIHLIRQDYAAAIAGLHRALTQAEANRERPVTAKIHLNLSEAYTKLGDATQALAHFQMFHALERDFNSNVAQTRARLLSNMFELEHSKSEAELARLEADVLRAQSAALAAEKRALEIRADELGRHANQDPLTGLWNRRYLDGRLAALFADRHAPNRALCIAACDIDHFKSINDRFGHATGDAVLVRVARLLTGGTRPSDLVARIGGEEFMLVFPDSDIAATAAACERLRVAIALHPWAEMSPDLAVTISIGVTCCGAAADLPAALRQADELLYQAKQNGRNLVRVAGTPVQ